VLLQGMDGLGACVCVCVCLGGASGLDVGVETVHAHQLCALTLDVCMHISCAVRCA
jgi:hypothetical protein